MSASAIIQAAEARFRSANYAAAAAVLAPLATDASPPPAALRLLGLCQLNQGNVQNAIASLTQASDLAPADLQIRLDRGRALHAGGRLPEAISPCFAPATPVALATPAPLLYLSRSLVAAGDVAGAIKAARKARLRAPAMAACEFTLGMAYVAGNFSDRAIKCLAAATRLEPGFIDAWVNLGVSLYEAGHLGAALEAMRKAHAINPGHVAASINLATYLALADQPQASEKVLREVLVAHPEAVEARVNLAVNLLHDERYDEIVALLEGPLPDRADPRCKWQVLRLLALANLGRFNEVRALLTQVGAVTPKLRTKLAWSRALLALADADPELARQEATAMAALLDRPAAMPPEHLVYGHYDLARVWSRLEEPAEAFANWERAHRLLAHSQPFSRASYEAFVDATIATFSAERLQQGPRASNRDELPVFIVGMPRSGTTLVEQILASHPAIHGAGERSALGVLFHQAGGALEKAAAVQRVGALDGPALDTHAAAYLAALRALDPAASRIIDKMPSNFRHLGLAGLLLPGARVISCERDPRDIGLSIFTMHFGASHGYSHNLADLGWYIGQQMRLMAHWRAVLPNPILTVRHEALVADFPGVLRQMLAFLGVDYDAQCERFYETERHVQTASRSQVRQPINADGVGRWRMYERQLEPMIAALKEAGALD